MGVLLSCKSVKGGSNFARWCDQKFSEIIDQALAETDIKKRTILYDKAQEIFKRETPWVTLAHATVFRAISKNVVDYQISPFGIESFYPVDIK